MITPLEQSVLNLIDDDQLIQWIQDLTRIPSVWKPELGTGEEPAARWVQQRCHEIGLPTAFEFVQPARPNVIAAYSTQAEFSLDDLRAPPYPPQLGGAAGGPRGGIASPPLLGGERGGRKLLMFEGHTDVVTEGDPSKWTDPPFSATIRNGRIYGRGANDMKAGVCCALMATKAIAQSGVRLNGDIVLGIVCDEEGRMIGIKDFVDRGWADRMTACIVCEPEENHLCIEQKGVMWVKVVIRGIMSHGAMPLTGVNTAYPMARFLTMAQALEEREIVRNPRSAFLGQPSITPTVLMSPVRNAGEPQNNVMPAASECTLDIRLIPGQDPDWIAAQLEKMVAAACAVDPRLSYDFQVIEVRHATKTDREHPVVTTLASAYSDLTTQPPIYGGVPGSTDGTILNARKGIPIVTCGPGDIYIPHHIDEWVSIDEIKTSVRMYVLAALRYLEAEGAE